jgi:predicted permease
MATLGRGRRQLASLLWKASVGDEVDAELAFHVEMRTRELIERGMDPAVARAAAEARFGNIAEVNHECRRIGERRERDMRRTEYVSELAQDVRFALRQLVRAPAFVAIASLTLALGVGATTAIFSAVEAVILRPFPYVDPGRLVFVLTHWSFGDGGASVGDYTEWRRRSTSFDEFGGFQHLGVTIANGESPERVLAAYATASVFPLYGVPPEQGRVFRSDEDQPGHNDVVVLSDGLWRRSFGGAPGVVGRTMIVDGKPHTIIGVMPARFDPTDSHEQLWIPAGFTAQQLAFHDEHFLTVVARLKRGATFAAAQHELDAIARQLAVEFPVTNASSGIRMRGFADTIIGDYRARLFVLLGAVSCVLLIACANVVNLLLARGAARSTELAIRTAIGAGRARIVRQLLTESLVLALLATAIGVLLAWSGIHVLVASAPGTIPRLATTRLDTTVLLFALGLAVVSAVGVGLVPALRATHGDAQASLREGGRGGGGGGATGSLTGARDRVRYALVVAEVAVAITLLAGAGLLIRSAIYLDHVDPGFDPRGLIAARVALRALPDSEQDALHAEQTFLRLAAELSVRPGVQAAAVTSAAPFGAGGGTNGLVPEGKERNQANAIDSRLRMVSPGYLAAMRIPVIAGRDIGESDRRGQLRVMVVSQALARTAWPGENPIGKRVACCEGTPEDPRWKTVIGVAADVRTGGPTQEIRPEFYLPIAQAPLEAWRWTNRTMTIVARATTGNATALSPTLRSTVESIDPTAPVYYVGSLSDRIEESMADSRFHLVLLVTLGVVGLLLAAAGIYGVIAYLVTVRTYEIGVRMALGATAADVVRLLTWGGLRPVLAGALLGGLASAWATRLLRGSLFGVGTTDPVTFLSAGVILLAVSIVAILVPARRATSVDPTVSLHG